jgi:acyl-CoA synthetase (AMP-forming)/AMP-acid ligase II
MQPSRSISRLIHQAVVDYPHATAVVFRDQSVSYLTLGITMAPSPVFLATVFALAALGACVVPLSTARSLEQRAQIAHKFNISLLMVDDATQALVGWPHMAIDNINIAQHDIDTFAAASHRQSADDLADLPWFVVLSSGTTDNLKGVAMSQAQTWVRIGQTALVWGRDTRTVPYEMSIAAGFFPTLRTLAAGGTVVIAEDADFQAGFSQFVQRHRATHVLLSPWMAGHLVKQLEGQKLAMPTLRSLWIGGGHCPRNVLEGLLERATPHVWLKYASAETGVVAAVQARMALSTPGLSGQLGHWVEAKVLDEQGNALNNGQSGMLSFRSEGWPTRYLVDADNADKAFRDGWYHSKDYGHLGLDGLVFVQGRAEGALNLAGIRLQSDYVEQLLMDQLAVSQCAALDPLQTDGSAQLAIVITPADEPKMAGIKTLLTQTFSHIDSFTIQVLVVEAIPRNIMGKVARRELKLLLPTTA